LAPGKLGIGAVRVHAAERDEHVGGCDLGDLLVRNRSTACLRLGVDGEDHRGHVASPVIRGHVLDGRFQVLAEVARGGGAPLRGQPILARPAELGLGVHVDRNDVVDVDAHRSVLDRG